jgi:hypothetical protein
MPTEVDLHGLYVKEAITYTDNSIAEARARGDKEIRLIVGPYSPFIRVRRQLTVCVVCVGKGIHSPNNTAKLKPAIEGLMQK